MRKRFVSLVLTFCALFLLALPACASDGESSDGSEATALSSGATGNFTDVPVGAWYAEGILYCTQRGLMTGVTNSSFSPESFMTRAMLAVVLYREAGSPPVTSTPNFTDAEESVWYSDAVSWAARAGILTGYGNGAFGVNDTVTREQMVTVLWRQEGSPESGQPEGFEDAAEISRWALEAVSWARSMGLVTGREDNRFDPAASITRGEVSMILYRYLNPGREETPPAHETLTVSVGARSFNVKLEDNPSALALAELTPMTITMGELNGNEKYYYLPETLPAAPERPGTIQAGDLMLYGTDCLVLFYEDFSSSYSYTRLGRIEDPEGLAETLGSGDVQVSFQMPASQNGDAPFFNFETRTVSLNSGYEMPLNGLGTYSLTGEVCVNSVAAALSSGVRLIDTAYMYHNEESVGEAVRSSGIPREEIFVVTKLYPSQFSNAETAIDQALERLDISYIDLMLLHHPGDGDVVAYKAMEQAVADGKVRSIGLSNWYVEELEEFLPQVTITPALVQNEIHPYYQENDVIPYIQSLGIVVQGWYPLGGRGHTAELLGDPVISQIAAAHGKSSAQVILRWNLQKGVVVIPGSSNPDHIQENTELYDFELSPEEMSQINALDRNEKHDWY